MTDAEVFAPLYHKNDFQRSVVRNLPPNHPPEGCGGAAGISVDPDADEIGHSGHMEFDPLG